MNVLLGVTGGIAAYKSAYLTRLFVKNGYSVTVIMTEAACRFITPLTMSTLSGNRVYTELFPNPDDHKDWHIELSKWADAFVIAPATANTIAKIAGGLADNLLTASVLSLPLETPLFIAPAMNTRMYENSTTRENVDRIKKTARLIGPVEGDLACGEKGIGAMADPDNICTAVDSYLKEKGNIHEV